MSAEPEPPPEEPPWEVSGYRFEEPLWMEALFSPFFWGLGPPLIVFIGYGLWRFFSG